MRFELVDRVLELEEGRIVTVKHVTGAEEYLRDHFPGFPVLPGVMMLESMAQAARRLLASREGGDDRWALGSVSGVKYGAMVQPGDALRVEVECAGPDREGVVSCKGTATLLRHGPEGLTPADRAAAGRFTMRRPRVGPGGDGVETGG